MKRSTVPSVFVIPIGVPDVNIPSFPDAKTFIITKLQTHFVI